MDDLRYMRPDTLEEACSALKEYSDAKVLSGGQSLLPMLRQRVASPDVVIDISRIPDQEYIEYDDDELSIGCLTRYVDIETSGTVHENCSVLEETVATIGDRQVRNHGTFCGAIAHADPSGDPPVLATALQADITARSVNGSTTYDAEEFYQGFYETELSPDEIVTEVRIPLLGDQQGAAYEKYEPSEGAYPTATVAVVVKTDENTIVDARIVVGALEPRPTQITPAEDRITGTTPDESTLNETAELVGDTVDPIEDAEGTAEFKSELSKSMAKKALETAINRANNGTPEAIPE